MEINNNISDFRALHMETIIWGSPNTLRKLGVKLF